MPRARRPCGHHGCPNLAERDGLCVRHLAEREAARGSSTERGYDAAHRAERARWAPKVARGNVRCWRCGEPIEPDEPWDLGHKNATERAPEHAGRCNRRAAALRGHGKPFRPAERRTAPRDDS